jgi:hypothetical protein
MSKKSDFVNDLHQEFFESRNALTRFEHAEDSADAKAAHKELTEAIKAATKDLSEKREALLSAIGKKKGKEKK